MQTPGRAGSWWSGCGLPSFPEQGPLCPSRSSPVPAPVAATSPEEAFMCKEWPGGIVSSVEAAAVRAAVAARSPREEFMGTTVPGGTMSSRGAGDRVVAAAAAVAEADRAQEKVPGWATPPYPMLRAPVAWVGNVCSCHQAWPPAQRLRAQDQPRRVPPASGSAALHTRLLWA